MRWAACDNDVKQVENSFMSISLHIDDSDWTENYQVLPPCLFINASSNLHSSLYLTKKKKRLSNLVSQLLV